MDKTALQSKKFITSLIGMVLVIVSGGAAVVSGNPAAIAALPYVIGGIVGLAGSQMVTQGASDIVQTIKKPITPESALAQNRLNEAMK